MPTNVDTAYMVAELEYQRVRSPQEKLKALEKMLSTAPTHKGAEKLRAEIKTKISKLKDKLQKEAARKKSGFSVAVKKEGAAQVVLVGTPNSGKSTLLNELTGSKVLVADYPFTTVKPEVGMMDFDGVKVQVVEIPAIVENFEKTENGPALLSIIRQADLMVWLYHSPAERNLLVKETSKINTPYIDYQRGWDIRKLIWQNLGIIKVYTKEPGKKPGYPPIALKKGACIKDMAVRIHKDFFRKFDYARIWGKSAKFPGQQVGIDHQLADNDVVEIHLN